MTRPAPPKHEGEERKIRLKPDQAEAIYINGVWISPGEEQFVAADDASQLLRDGKAVKVEG